MMWHAKFSIAVTPKRKGTCIFEQDKISINFLKKHVMSTKGFSRPSYYTIIITQER
jgi:hypothetical protein